MRRRTLIAAAAGAGLAPKLARSATGKSIFELTCYRMRNSPDNQMTRTSDFLSKHCLPAAQRAGIGPVGLFASMVADEGPFLLCLAGHASLTAMEAAERKLSADKGYQQALEAYQAVPGLAYQRIEKSLLRGFDSMPGIETPPVEDRKTPRVFELRVYESNNFGTLKRKMKMFDDGEIAIFRRLGMLPVFFGETIVGQRMPNLTYMLAFDDLASREKAWRAFSSDPEWQKMRVLPGLSDAEVVSNSSTAMLRPLPASAIR